MEEGGDILTTFHPHIHYKRLNSSEERETRLSVLWLHSSVSDTGHSASRSVRLSPHGYGNHVRSVFVPAIHLVPSRLPY
jgi:hypothetical protein